MGVRLERLESERVVGLGFLNERGDRFDIATGVAVVASTEGPENAVSFHVGPEIIGEAFGGRPWRFITAAVMVSPLTFRVQPFVEQVVAQGHGSGDGQVWVTVDGIAIELERQWAIQNATTHWDDNVKRVELTIAFGQQILGLISRIAFQVTILSGAPRSREELLQDATYVRLRRP
jgi:hypothetical protein